MSTTSPGGNVNIVATRRKKCHQTVTKGKMNYAIYGKLSNGTEENIYSDGRTWKRKSSAQMHMEQMQDVIEQELFIKEVPFTDTDRLDCMIKYGWSVYRFWGGFRVYQEGGHPIVESKSNTPREAIDAAITATAKEPE